MSHPLPTTAAATTPDGAVSRRHLLGAAGVTTGAAAFLHHTPRAVAAPADDKADDALDADGPLEWHSPRQDPFALIGFCWFDQDEVYRRLPVEPDWPLPAAVERLANNTAGGQIRFRTDSTRVAVRVTLSGAPSMNHMPATGQCGFDVYVGDWGDQQYWGTAKPSLGKTEYEATFFTTPEPQSRTITLNFPLYQGVEKVEVGLDSGATTEAAPDFELPGRLVVYGTSITQGGCASRPGTAYPAELSRRLAIETVNLGFSGSGKGEQEVARTIAQIDDVSCFVLDYESNVATAADMKRTLSRFIPILRERHPQVPIVVVSKTPRIEERFDPDALADRLAKRKAQADVVTRLQRGGDEWLEFLDLGEHDLTASSVDGVHLTDGGFTQLADLVEPSVRRWVSA
ncbi:MAG TPA: SGNH/GDSL hydrolase family protein [Candidatus Avipropionibacterium avicola]|uniref:SGNH/GDSL hydrolase family protein n=1 Tax=Candidatus Avipropionibacterium avicola TaxID=2840701 RepID=A0A9D1GZN0_9ACTN|nr:SGNH/GDSL hydrolase family protein [Candidatus Avipropionibacterium avicola]